MSERENTTRGARVHENGEGKWPVPTASLLARPRPEKKMIETATAIPVSLSDSLRREGKWGTAKVLAGLDWNGEV